MTPTRIRELLSYATHLRRDMLRKTPSKLANDTLAGPALTKCIDDLKALDIPAALKTENMLREAELGACEDLLRWWNKQREGGQPVPKVTAALICPDGKRIELGEGVMIDFETYSDEGTAAHEIAERLYGRNGVVLRVIDGGKK